MCAVRRAAFPYICRHASAAKKTPHLLDQCSLEHRPIVAEVELVAKVVLRWYLLQPLRPTAEREVEAAVAAAAMQ